MSALRLPLVRMVLAALILTCVRSPAPAQTSSSKRSPTPFAPFADRSAVQVRSTPLVSRGKRAFGRSPLPSAEPRNINDGDYSTSWNAGWPSPSRPAWIAVDVGVGPGRLLLNWSAAGSFNYNETDYGSPGAYHVDTSADSTDGGDGTWRTVVDVPNVSTHGQAHSFDFVGQRWVKLVVTRAPDASPNGVQIDEVDIHDASSASADLWFFMGDSITAFAFDRAPAHQPSFAAWLHERHPERFPAMIDGGVGGDKSDEGVAHLDEWLTRNPDAHFWAIGYGTNDAAGDASETSRFRANLQTMISRLHGAGRVPILASIPFASDGQHHNIPNFNRVVDELQRSNSLPAGPDLYAWFSAHPDELRDGVHPNDRGIVSINRLWAHAADDALHLR